jgi:hypothetical protein
MAAPENAVVQGSIKSTKAEKPKGTGRNESESVTMMLKTTWLVDELEVNNSWTFFCA